jgi:hypothetical protein
MGRSTPSNQPSISVAVDTLITRLPKKVLGAGLGAVVAGLVLAPSPAQALTQACADVTSPLATTDSCTIVYKDNSYNISLISGSFANAFPAPSTDNMFWWGHSPDGIYAAIAVGTAFGGINHPVQEYGPFFAFQVESIPEWSTFQPSESTLFVRSETLYIPNPHTNNVLSPTTGWDGQWTGNHATYGGPLYYATSTLVTSAAAGPSASVPGPLPILGLAAAFGFSRKLRQRIKLHKGTSAVSASPGS